MTLNQERLKLVYCDKLSGLITRLQTSKLSDSDKLILVVAVNNLAQEILNNSEGLERLYGSEFFNDIFNLD